MTSLASGQRRQIRPQHFTRVRRRLPPSRRGLAFDLAILLANLLLVRVFSGQMGELGRLALSDDPTASRDFGAVLLVAFLAQMVGAYFKRGPLQVRLASRGAGVAGGFGCLLVLHFVLSLSTFVTIVAASPFEPSPTIIVPGFFFCLLSTALVWRALTPPRTLSRRAWLMSPKLEAAADVALFAYVLVNLSFLSVIAPAFHSMPVHSVSEFFTRAASGLLISPLLLMYYLCPRLLFLVEDYRYPATWISMTAAILPIALRFVFG